MWFLRNRLFIFWSNKRRRFWQQFDHYPIARQTSPHCVLDSKFVSDWRFEDQIPEISVDLYQFRYSQSPVRLSDRGGHSDFRWQSRGDFVLKENYATSRPTSWTLQELAARNLTRNASIISKRWKVDSGEWSIWSGKISRKSSRPEKRGFKRSPIFRNP